MSAVEAARFPHGCVAAPHHLAASAGAAVLAGGGNAVDAAVAANLVLAVVTPHACGPRLVAAFVDAADPAKLPATCVTYFENSVPPPVWSGRLEPRP